MAKNSTYKLGFRRKREGKTNYKKRLDSVKGRLPRLSVRISNRYVLAQIIEFNTRGDRTIAAASSRELEKFGWTAAKKNIPSAYLTGMLAATRAKAKKKENAVLDIGFRTPVHGSRCFAVLKGALDAGLKISFDKSALPKEERVSGTHIGEYAKKLSPEDFKKKFSDYAKKNIDAKNLSAMFESAKKKILEEVK